MKIWAVLVVTLVLGGCAGVELVKDAAGKKLLDGMNIARSEFCGGFFPKATYEKFLREHGKTWSQFNGWCNLNEGSPGDE